MCSIFFTPSFLWTSQFKRNIVGWHVLPQATPWTRPWLILAGVYRSLSGDGSTSSRAALQTPEEERRMKERCHFCQDKEACLPTSAPNVTWLAALYCCMHCLQHTNTHFVVPINFQMTIIVRACFCAMDLDVSFFEYLTLHKKEKTKYIFCSYVTLEPSQFTPKRVPLDITHKR
uniref:Uncharacterized protein n=1 Tax=Nothobranchius furzeri TaxID=105023 RepID=A0A1A8AAP0_NOTFU